MTTLLSVSRRRLRPSAPVDRSLLDVDRSALAVVTRLLDCARTARTGAEAWRFIGFAAANLDELLVTHGPHDDADLTCSLDGHRTPAYLHAVVAVQDALHGEVRRRLRADAGPVRGWFAVGAAGQARARAALAECWSAPGDDTGAPAFLPSRRLALLMVPRDGLPRCVPLPVGVPRFLPVDRRGTLVPVEAAVRAVLQADAGGDAPTVHAVRPLRRERTFAWSDLAEEPAAGVSQLLALREGGPLFLVEHAAPMPERLRAALATTVAAAPGLRESPVPLAAMGPVPELAALAALPAPRGVLRGVRGRTPPPLPPQPFSRLLARGEQLAGFPGHDFEATVGRFIAEAARDPGVTGLDATLYRVDAASALFGHLEAAARRGVAVRVTVELRARGDEARNLAWHARLAAAGVQVDTGPGHLKVHGKLLLVTRGDGAPALGYVGTGNLHAGTARAYLDLGLFSSDPAITADIGALFAALRGGRTPPPLGLLAAAPWTLRPRMLDLLATAAGAARAGRRVTVQVKLNGLTDPRLIAALHDAAAAGVRVRLAVRGLCLARPHPDGALAVVAPAGHLLHHARALTLAVDGVLVEAWLGSADWRERNLDRRIEVWAPLREPAHRQFLAGLLAADFRARAGWTLLPNGRQRSPHASRRVFA